MGLRLKDVLRLDVLQRADPEIVAGAGHLDRKVRWVHISELPDIAYLLKGGELLLTTGLALSRDDALQRRYVRELAEVGIAGIVVELGRTFTHRLPDRLVEEAERCEIPLIALHRETRYVEVTEQVHAAIIHRQYELLRKAERVGQEFTQLVLSGATLGRIAHRLAGIVENPVILEDAAHQVVEFATHSAGAEDILATWETHSRFGHQTSAEIVTHIEGEDPRCLWIPIVLRGESWGMIHILEIDTLLDDDDRLALDRASAALGLALFADRDAIGVSDHAHGALIFDLLHGRYGSNEEIFRRCRALGADLEGKFLAATVIESEALVNGAEGAVVESEVQRIQSLILAAVRAGIASAGASSLTAAEGNKVLAVIGVDHDTDISGELRHIGELILKEADHASPDSGTVVGIGGQVPIEAIRRSFEEAREAARYALQAPSSSRVHLFAELGLLHLLLRLSDGPQLPSFVESELSPILSHDARSASPLLPTLTTYLDSGGSKSKAARALHIERRTLYHRLDRIERLLQLDLDEPQVRTRLAVALMGLDILHRRSFRRATMID